MTNKRYTKKSIYKIAAIAVVLLLLVFSLGYVILYTDILQPGVDELTAGYISFYNAESTDMLKIINISKKTDKKGKLNINKSSVSFEVDGSKDDEFEIILYSTGNSIDGKYIKYYIYNDKESVTKDLSQVDTTSDDGKIIYKGKITNNNKYTINMWIDNNYNGNTKNISYEVKIKSS